MPGTQQPPGRCYVPSMLQPPPGKRRLLCEAASAPEGGPLVPPVSLLPDDLPCIVTRHTLHYRGLFLDPPLSCQSESPPAPP